MEWGNKEWKVVRVWGKLRVVGDERIREILRVEDG